MHPCSVSAKWRQNGKVHNIRPSTSVLSMNLFQWYIININAVIPKEKEHRISICLTVLRKKYFLVSRKHSVGFFLSVYPNGHSQVNKKTSASLIVVPPLLVWVYTPTTGVRPFSKYSVINWCDIAPVKEQYFLYDNLYSGSFLIFNTPQKKISIQILVSNVPNKMWTAGELPA